MPGCSHPCLAALAGDVTAPERADLPTWECYDLVESCTVGRLCFLDGTTPITYPVSFTLHRTETGPQVLIRTGPGSLIAAYAGPASFELDEIDVDARVAWSVLLRGALHRVHDPSDLPVPEPWITGGQRVWMSLEVGTASGRRFVAKPSADDFAVEWEIDVSSADES